MGSAIRRMRSKPVLPILALLYLAIASAYLLPPLRILLDAFFTNYSQIILIGFLILNTYSRCIHTHHIEEKRFWLFISIGFSVWFVSDAIDILRAGEPENTMVNIISDGLDLTAYLGCMLAAEQKPHEFGGWSRGDLGYRFANLGTSIFLFAVLAYFVFIPAYVNTEAYNSFIPTVLMFVFLDGFVAVRFWSLRHSCKDRVWARSYAWLGLAFVIWFFGDLHDAVYYIRRIDIVWGTPIDLPYYVPFGIVILVSQLQPTRIIQRQSHTQSIKQMHSEPIMSATGILAVCAFLLPVIHFALHALDLLDESYRPAQEIVVLAALLGLLGMAYLQQLLLGRKNRELESEKTVLVNIEKMQQAQKMEALGRLAGGVAHDFNNILTIISGYSSMLENAASITGDNRAYVECIAEASKRAESLTNQLLAFGRRQVLQPTVLDLNREIAGTEKMLRRLISEDIEIVIDLDPELGHTIADPGQIAQIIMNLVINAREAMPHGGTITIRTANKSIESVCRRYDEIPAGCYVSLTVTDTGQGMEKAVMERIFEPFFTTRGFGHGFGLATVYGIVKQSGGYIDVSSAPGEGTEFQILLPPASCNPDIQPGERDQVTVCVGNETILVAEDDDNVREMIRRSLKKRGYNVLVARSGSEALRISMEYDGPIHLLLTDVMMPKIGGCELSTRIMRRRPEIPVVFISGYPNETMVERGGLASDAVLLKKPFSPEELARTIRERLDCAVKASCGLLSTSGPHN